MNIKSLLLSLAFLAMSQILAAQDFEWTKQIGSVNNDQGYCVTTDTDGNIYTTGVFHGTADFDPSTNTFALTSAGDADIFISKTDALGSFMWATRLGGAAGDVSRSISCDHIGNIYITGSFQGTCDFDPGAGNLNLSSAGGSDIFVLKLDATGELIWARQIGGTGLDRGLSIKTDTRGNVLTTGFFENTADFDPGIATFNLNAFGYHDIFISKLDPSGNFKWATKIGEATDDEGTCITNDAYGNIYVTGRFQGTCDFDPSATMYNLVSPGNEDIFISKFDSLGNFLWAKQFGDFNIDYGNSIAIDNSGNVYTTGAFRGIADFRPGGGTHYLTSEGESDIFISKLDAQGNFVWAKKIGSTSSDIAYAISTDASGNVYTTGQFNGTVDFDPDSSSFNLDASAGANIFISKLDPSGKFMWAGQLGLGTGQSITIDTNYNIYTTGTFSNTSDFDPSAGTFNLSSAGDGDIFIHKMSQTPTAMTKTNAPFRFSAFPNPTNGGLIITQQLNGNIPFAIYDIAGKLLTTGQLASKETKLDLSKYHNGIYLLKINQQIIKIAKQ
ncbi:MAG: hypothetical protein RL660_1725 [Bacteroidota bacterium]|jgi:hypothetical protein